MQLKFCILESVCQPVLAGRKSNLSHIPALRLLVEKMIVTYLAGGSVGLLLHWAFASLQPTQGKKGESVLWRAALESSGNALAVDSRSEASIGRAGLLLVMAFKSGLVPPTQRSSAWEEPSAFVLMIFKHVFLFHIDALVDYFAAFGGFPEFPWQRIWI